MIAFIFESQNSYLNIKNLHGFAYLIDICQVSTMWAGAVLSTGVADVIKMGTVPVLL